MFFICLPFWEMISEEAYDRGTLTHHIHQAQVLHVSPSDGMWLSTSFMLFAQLFLTLLGCFVILGRLDRRDRVLGWMIPSFGLGNIVLFEEVLPDFESAFT